MYDKECYKYFIIYIYITSPTRLRLEIWFSCLFLLNYRSGSTVTPCFIEKFSFEYYFSEKTLPALISVLPY